MSKNDKPKKVDANGRAHRAQEFDMTGATGRSALS